MKRKLMVLAVIIVSMGGFLFGQEVFDPQIDGWYFENWGEEGSSCIGSCDFSWDLYKRTYLGIYPTKTCAAAPLDCAFYEIFKGCARQGNCGGMSILALALFKYGGYLGFCSPANFYTGTDGPDREDLHRVLNIIQARQFSVSGITRFIDAVDRGTLNNAEAAFDNVKEQLGKGDYPVIWIASDTIGGDAHTVIPYRVQQSGSQKIMYIWDPNNPYDDYPDRYDNNIENRLIINGPTSWSYNSGDPSDPIVYSGGGWCLCVPLSDIMKKSRHPFAIDVAAEVLQTLFVGGPGAAVSQVTDDQGRRLYKNDNDTHTSWSEIETHPDKRLKGVVRWPWPGYKGKPPGELYFIRAPRGKIPNLKVTCSGKNYNVMFHSSGNLVEIKTISPGKTRDILRFSKIDSYEQSIEIKTSGNQREYDVKQLRTDITRKNYRSFHVKNLKIDPNLPVVPITIDIVGDFEAVEVSAKERKINFQVDILQNREGKVTTRQLKKLTTVPGKQLMIAPKNWMKLDTTELEKKTSIRLKKKKKQTNKKF